MIRLVCNHFNAEVEYVGNFGQYSFKSDELRKLDTVCFKIHILLWVLKQISGHFYLQIM